MYANAESRHSFEIAITDLCFRTKVDDIYEAFRKFGEISDCHIVLNERNESCGYGFITYKSHRDAVAAINNMDNFCMDGRLIRVAFASGEVKPSQQSTRVRPNEIGYKTTH